MHSKRHQPSRRFDGRHSLSRAQPPTAALARGTPARARRRPDVDVLLAVLVERWAVRQLQHGHARAASARGACPRRLARRLALCGLPPCVARSHASRLTSFQMLCTPTRSRCGRRRWVRRRGAVGLTRPAQGHRATGEPGRHPRGARSPADVRQRELRLCRSSRNRDDDNDFPTHRPLCPRLALLSMPAVHHSPCTISSPSAAG